MSLLDQVLKVFDRKGGEWVGLATGITLFFFFLQSVGVKIIVPPWWTSPGGVYSVILGCFVVSKSGSYYINSKYNSPAGVPPSID